MPKKSLNSAQNVQAVKVEYQVLKQIQLKANELSHKGMNAISAPIQLIESAKDYWLVSELGSSTLGKGTFQIKGIFLNGERVYEILHLPMYQQLMHESHSNLKVLLRSILSAFDLIHKSGIVHADIKPENILLSIQDGMTSNVKLIDFGSAFYFDKPSNIRMSTPEYLAPEVLNYFGSSKFICDKFNSTNLCKCICPWSYDIWSLGCIFLELLIGFPLWLSLKAKVPCKEGYVMTKGLFASCGRDEKKILMQQLNVISNLDSLMSTFGIDKHPEAVDLLKKMLDLNPLKRISPTDALKHKYLI